MQTTSQKWDVVVSVERLLAPSLVVCPYYVHAILGGIGEDGKDALYSDERVNPGQIAPCQNPRGGGADGPKTIRHHLRYQ